MSKYVIFMSTILLQASTAHYAADSAQIPLISLHSKEIVLPLAPTIAKRLSHLNLTHFTKATKIHKQLAGSKMTPIRIAHRVMLIIDEYNVKNDALYVVEVMERCRPSIIKALVQDSPEALEELELLGVFEKRVTSVSSNTMIKSLL